ncbi:hypothetical protein ATO3_11605 [Marinibacterium profundimaris]|uniref:Uncharacterized protein n=1 Tax=Marinibacterium profundimaris TaxID=1679460 RepID=A0A225NHN7_9RHOB|nr:hypothetical protein ATO3_11605 [Marinibacterium profundimaris]
MELGVLNMYDTLEAAPAEHILGMGNEGEVFGLMSELTRSRRLSVIVRQLNEAVLDGEIDERDRAIAALSRMGLWFE